MFYETSRRDHGLPHDPFKAIVAPRPIGWISTISRDGVTNLAPYSYFNAISSRPDLILFSSEGEKDSVRNARDTGEFVASHVSAKLADAMNSSSIPAPEGISEFDHCKIATARSRLVRPPRVAAACAALECRVTEIVEPKDLGGNSAGVVVVIGQVVGVYIDDSVIRDGRFDVALAEPVSRLGYLDFDGPDGLFSLARPDWKG
ncbi:MAG: flavin reductase family protein [Nitratireductor sp.]